MTSPTALEHGLNTKRTAIHLQGTALLSLSFQTLGIIYSDIGTSPLYVLNSIWPASDGVPSEEDIIGGVSAIVWAMTLLPLLKYVIISLWFGTREGEGGSFALYQGLYPPYRADFDEDRTLTGDTQAEVKATSGGIKGTFRWPLLLWCLFGTALTMADGVFTPAVSVTSAIGGIAVAKPSVVDNIIPISVVILLALFFVQQFGTARLAFTFAPISMMWFILLAVTGIINITAHPGIFRAFDPSRAVTLFIRTRDYDMLAGVLLAVTGCEAVFANLGQFNAASIRLSFVTIVYPALILAYLGQGARLIRDGDAVLNNIFYRTIPGPANGGLFWVMFVFAILATIIASQALITATFSLVQQLINSKAFPPIRMLYTSDTIQGQVYIPAVNWALMVMTVVVVAAFKDLANLTNAYGFAVATVMLSTTILLSVQIYYVKRLWVGAAIGFFLVFGFFDGLFWGAALKKVPEGAWVPLLIGFVLLLVMSLWTWAKALEDTFDGANRKNLRHFIHQTEGQDDSASEAEIDLDASRRMTLAYSYMSETTVMSEKKWEESRKPLQRIPSCAIFHKVAQGKGIPHTFVGFIRQWPALPRVVIFLSVCIVPIARVPVGERYVVTKVRTVEGFYGVTYYIGFRDDFDVNVNDLIDKICSIERGSDSASLAAAISEIRTAAQTYTHISPHYHVVSKRLDAGVVSPVVNYVRKYLIEDLYRRLATMFPETANWLTSADEIIRVGINAVI